MVTNEALIGLVLAEYPRASTASTLKISGRAHNPNDLHTLGALRASLLYCRHFDPAIAFGHHRKGFPSRTDMSRTPQNASRTVRVQCDILPQIDRAK
jgi:hypothetical protein